MAVLGDNDADSQSDFANRRDRGRGPKSVESETGGKSRSAAGSTAATEESDLLSSCFDLSKLGLYGRDKEMTAIQHCLKELEHKGRNQLVYIAGVSGTGKTALAKTLADKVPNGLFAVGKFDQKLRDEPYAGISAACRNICGEILLLRDKPDDTGGLKHSFQEIRQKIIDEVDLELGILSLILPEIEEIVGETGMAKEDEEEGQQQGSHGANKERFNFAFQRFVRCIASFFSPLVLVLDDLQWADLPSINLIEALMTDEKRNNFMLVALYRSNEVHETHFVTSMISTLDEREKNCNYRSTKINIGDLGVFQISEILVDVLEVDTSRTIELAEVVYRRTNGNAFFVINFLAMLSERKLITFSDTESTWVWDENKIERETIAADNVVDLLTAKMKDLPEGMRRLMRIGACLGASFREDVILKVAKGYFEGEETTDENIRAWLIKASTKGFLKWDSMVGYAWIHDKVQEAVLALSLREELTVTQFRVGELLARRLSKAQTDAVLFVMVNLLNAGADSLPMTRKVWLAEYNLRAATKAMRLAAFESVSNYTRRGIDLLPADHWSMQYKLSMKLYSLAVEVHSVLGNVAEMDSLCEQVLSLTDRPLEDKMRVYIAKAESLAGRDPESSKALLFDVLDQMGIKVPHDRWSLAMNKKATMTKFRFQKKLNLDKVKTMPIMSNPRAVRAMKLLDLLLVQTFVSNKDEMIAVTNRMFDLVNKHGICYEATSAYALRACTMISLMNDVRNGTAHGHFAARISQRLGKPTDFKVYSIALSCATEFMSLPKIFMDIHYKTLQAGDVQTSMYALANVYFYYPLCGRPLGPIEQELRGFVSTARVMQRMIQDVMLSIMWQALLNLTGESDDPLIMKGEAMDETRCKLLSASPFLQAQNALFTIFLYTFCGNHKATADEFTGKLPLIRSEMAGMGLTAMVECYTGLASLDCARKYNSKYRAHGEKVSKKVKDWIKQGNPNLTHWDQLLDAELAVLKGNTTLAVTCYKESMEIAEKKGLIQDAGLIAERYGEYLYQLKHKEGARRCFKLAIDYFGRWSAAYKVSTIQSTYKSLLQGA